MTDINEQSFTFGDFAREAALWVLDEILQPLQLLCDVRVTFIVSNEFFHGTLLEPVFLVHLFAIDEGVTVPTESSMEKYSPCRWSVANLP